MTIKEIIINYKHLCEINGWSQQIAAEEIGCDRSHLSRIFSGKRHPSMQLLEQIEKKLNEYNFKG